MPNIISPSYEIIYCPDGQEVLKQIEKIARTCYKSENKITEGSARKLILRLLNSGHHAMIEFGDIIIRFISNRGFSHELVRHRLSSFAQESTRHCNYSKNRFGHEISVLTLHPDIHKKTTLTPRDIERAFRLAYSTVEKSYMYLIENGVPPDFAREVLPIGLKTEIVHKANIREWRHIFSLRCAKKAHPRMRELMIPLLHDLNKRIPVLFEDLANKFPRE
jgi:thymidylate synthase (FAD)